MITCESFNQRLLKSVPYSARTFVEGSFRSLTSSEAALDVLKTSIDSLLVGHRLDPVPSIVVIGSFGRLDGTIKTSDVDIVHVYPGENNDSHEEILQTFLKDLVEYNKGLIFDHRNEIVEERFDFRGSPAYPMISANSLQRTENSHRALQILTEGRILNNGNGVGNIRADILTRFGFSDNISSFDMTAFCSALAAYRDSYCDGVMNRTVGSGWQLPNKKVVKLFALREFSYLATLFALTEVSLAVAVGVESVVQAAERLSSPSLLKVSSFCDPVGPLGICIDRLSDSAKKEVTKLVKSQVKSLPTAERMAIVDSTGNPSEGEFFRELRNLTLPVLKQYDSLLSSLHDSKFLDTIKEFEPDITTWLGRPQYQKILSVRNKMIDRTRLLAQVISECLLLVGESGNTAVEPAIGPLQEIAEYELRLALAPTGI